MPQNSAGAAAEAGVVAIAGLGDGLDQEQGLGRALGPLARLGLLLGQLGLELLELAREHRVVTITGPGGVGKTRILSELGRRLAPHGVRDGLRDPRR